MTKLLIAEQRSKCFLALASLDYCLQRVDFPEGEEKNLALKMQFWLKECEKKLAEKPKAAKVQKQITALLNIFKSKITTDTYVGWAACMWAVLTLLEDVKILCPAFFGKEFRNLLQATTSFGHSLYELDAGIAELGTYIYWEVA